MPESNAYQNALDRAAIAAGAVAYDAAVADLDAAIDAAYAARDADLERRNAAEKAAAAHDARIARHARR